MDGWPSGKALALNTSERVSVREFESLTIRHFGDLMIMEAYLFCNQKVGVQFP